MALWMWTRNRQTRHRRHMQLLEDMSMTSSAGGGGTVSAGGEGGAPDSPLASTQVA